MTLFVTRLMVRRKQVDGGSEPAFCHRTKGFFTIARTEWTAASTSLLDLEAAFDRTLVIRATQWTKVKSPRIHCQQIPRAANANSRRHGNGF
jgi:hypothetical protein